MFTSLYSQELPLEDRNSDISGYVIEYWVTEIDSDPFEVISEFVGNSQQTTYTIRYVSERSKTNVL